MPLPTTNISLNAIHVEVGGTSGTQVSLNDADVRSIGSPDATYAGADGINTTSGTTISIGEFRNATDTWSTTLTIGTQTIKSGTRYGFLQASTGGTVYYGSLSDSTVDTLSNHSLDQLTSPPGIGTGIYIDLPPTGWTSFRLYGGSIDNTVSRTSMTYSSSGYWYLLSGSTTYITNTSGATMTLEVTI